MVQLILKVIINYILIEVKNAEQRISPEDARQPSAGKGKFDSKFRVFTTIPT